MNSYNRLEDKVKTIETVQASELQGVAQELFNDEVNINQKTKLKDEERALCLVNGVIFTNILGMPELDPSREFKELSSSVDGWKTEKFVQAAQGTHDVRQNGGFFDKLKGLFQRREKEM